MSALAKINTYVNTTLGEGVTPDNVTRYSGGVKNIHPFISGYWIMQFKSLPTTIFTDVAQHVTIKNWFRTSAEGFTPPNKTLNKTDVPGMGGLGSSFLTGQTLTRTFSTTHREYSGLKLFNIINLWGNVIDVNYGVNVKGKTFYSSDYKADLYVGLLKPTVQASGALQAEDFEQVFLFSGVFPETIPYDSLNQDISTNDSIQLSVTWNFDGWPKTLATHDTLDTELASEIGSFSNYMAIE